MSNGLQRYLQWHFSLFFCRCCKQPGFVEFRQSEVHIYQWLVFVLVSWLLYQRWRSQSSNCLTLLGWNSVDHQPYNLKSTSCHALGLCRVFPAAAFLDCVPRKILPIVIIKCWPNPLTNFRAAVFSSPSSAEGASILQSHPALLSTWI